MRAHRIARGLSRDALAARSGVSASSISHMELEAQRPWRVTLRKLARALGVEPAELLPGKTQGG
jgi:transcriptional regulator with XRE-family HTH domain